MYVGGNLIGTYTNAQPVERDLLIVVVCREPGVRKKRVAEAFRVSKEALRRVFLKHREGGLQRVAQGHRRGRPRLHTPELEQELFALFEQGMSIRDAHKQLKQKVSLALVAGVRKKWGKQQLEAAGSASSNEEEERVGDQLSAPTASKAAPAAEQNEELPVEQNEELPVEQNEELPAEPSSVIAKGAKVDDELDLEQACKQGARRVEHLGAWIMLAMLQALGLYTLAERLRDEAEHAEQKAGRRFISRTTLRAALDAVVIALSLGKRCVEGVAGWRRPAAPRCCAASK